MREFKIGDEVKIIGGGYHKRIHNLVGKKGVIQDIDGYMRYFFYVRIDGKKHSMTRRELELIKEGDAMDNLEVGTILVGEDGYEQKVLGICGKVYFLSCDDDFDVASSTIQTLKELKEDCKVKVETKEPKKMTVSEIAEALGHDVEVVKG